jgi:NTP pyrophosphatase (non-canonical NTP hydrolase)
MDIRVVSKFLGGFTAMQQSVAAVNSRSGFNQEDRLIDAFEAYCYGHLPGDVVEKYKSLFPAFRNARVGLKLMLAVGELSELLETVRKNMGSDDHCPMFSAEAVELADAVIRIMNYATERGIPLGEAIVAKNDYNTHRHDHSKEGRAAEHGKRF